MCDLFYSDYDQVKHQKRHKKILMQTIEDHINGQQGEVQSNLERQVAQLELEKKAVRNQLQLEVERLHDQLERQQQRVHSRLYIPLPYVFVAVIQ